MINRNSSELLWFFNFSLLPPNFDFYFRRDDPLDPLDLISYSPETSENEMTQMVERKTNVWKETFLQNENCFATCESLPQCYECFKNPMVNKYSCRFYEFRKIDRCNGRFTAVGFLDPFTDPTLHDEALWVKPENHLKVDQETADYILSLIASQFCEISEAELKISQKHKEDHKEIAWKRSVLQVREICDVCDTSVFNIHWTCSHCGTCVCIDCFNERRDGISRWKPKTKSDKEERDMHFWLKCQRREVHDMKLVQMTSGETLKSLNATLHTVCDQRNITQKCGCSLRTKNCLKMQTKRIMLEQNKSDSEFRQIMKNQRHKDKKIVRRRYSLMEQARIYKTVTLTFISKNRILKILEPTESSDCYKAFQSEWEQGKPVVVSNVTRNMRMDIWSPEYFSRRFGNEKHVMVNCENGISINRVATKFFWDGFAAIENRIPTQNAHSDKIVLKLKDWPTSDDFANVMKEHFEDVMGAVPLAAYTRRDGKFNLARYLPEHFSRPDLGPKMYSAYSQTHPSKQGSTNLHLDVSDAINIMLHVSKPSDAHLAPKQYGYEAILHALEAAGVDENDKTYFKKETQLPGAIWHIFPAHQADGIRKLLQTVAKENGKPLGANDDPIHDQVRSPKLTCNSNSHQILINFRIGTSMKSSVNA